MDGKFGKFASAEELEEAYNALEKEFTKRCQLVKELQARVDELSAQADRPAETAIDADVVCMEAERGADRSSAEAAEAPQHGQSDAQDDALSAAFGVIAEHAAEIAQELASLPCVEEVCIANYKKRLLGFSAIPSPGGYAVMMPAKRPRTLADAKRLADEILR